MAPGPTPQRQPPRGMAPAGGGGGGTRGWPHLRPGGGDDAADEEMQPLSPPPAAAVPSPSQSSSQSSPQSSPPPHRSAAAADNTPSKSPRPNQPGRGRGRRFGPRWRWGAPVAVPSLVLASVLLLVAAAFVLRPDSVPEPDRPRGEGGGERGSWGRPKEDGEAGGGPPPAPPPPATATAMREVNLPLASSSFPPTGDGDDMDGGGGGWPHATYGPSLLSTEVEAVAHRPDLAEVVVRFRAPEGVGGRRRRCADPVVVGRLSGPAAALVDWGEPAAAARARDGDGDGDGRVVMEMVGRYEVPLPGRYLLEVVGMMCNGVGFGEDFRGICLEDPTRHRLTHEAAHIDVVSVGGGGVRRGRRRRRLRPGKDGGDLDLDLDLVSDPDGRATSVGYWERAPPYGPGGNATAPPLLTRYQPHGCRGDEALATSRCGTAMELRRFAPYRFVYDGSHPDAPDLAEGAVRSRARRIEQAARAGGGPPHLLCMVGASHARELATAMELWLREWDITGVVAQSMSALFPADVDGPFIRDSILRTGCQRTLVAEGQWSLGRKPDDGPYGGMPATLFPDYEREVEGMIGRLRGAGVENFALRSIHYNSLGDVKTLCPPLDWRSPPIVDGYNAILRNLTSGMGVPYIDTNFIIGPMWDSAGDFCHYRDDEVSKAEALYVLGRLLSPLS